MKKMLPLLIITLIFTLSLAGAVSAAIMEEPLELGEGEIGITAVREELVEIDPEIVEVVVGRGIEGEVVITGIGDDVAFRGTEEDTGEVLSFGPGIADMQIEIPAPQKNYLPYGAAAAAVLLISLFGLRKKAFASR